MNHFNGKLPLEYPIGKILKIYIKRLLIFFVVALVSLFLLSFALFIPHILSVVFIIVIFLTSFLLFVRCFLRQGVKFDMDCEQDERKNSSEKMDCEQARNYILRSLIDEEKLNSTGSDFLSAHLKQCRDCADYKVDFGADFEKTHNLLASSPPPVNLGALHKEIENRKPITSKGRKISFMKPEHFRIAASVAMAGVVWMLSAIASPFIKTERSRMAVSVVMAGLALLLTAVAFPQRDDNRSIKRVSKDVAILPQAEVEIEVMKPPPPPAIKPPKRFVTPRKTTTVVRQNPSKPPPSNITPIRSNRPPPPSPNPGSSIANIRSVVGAPPGGYRPGEYDRAGNTTDDGEGFVYEWRPPFASTDVEAAAVSGQQQQVIITRLKHTLSNYHVYDDSLKQLESNLNSNNPEMRFSMNLQQAFSPYGCILLIMGEDPLLASTSGRLIEDLTDSFTDDEVDLLRKYLENKGIIIIMEATPYRSSTNRFVDKMRKEVIKIGEEWEGSQIFFESDFIKEFNQSKDYSFLAGKLTDVLGKQIN